MRDPRPEGTQKGVSERGHQSEIYAFLPGANARTPWLFSHDRRAWWHRETQTRELDLRYVAQREHRELRVRSR